MGLARASASSMHNRSIPPPRALLSPDEAEDERDREQDQENDEQNLGDAGGGSCDAAKAEHAGNDRDDQEDQGPVEHGISSRGVTGSTPALRCGCRCST